MYNNLKKIATLLFISSLLLSSCKDSSDEKEIGTTFPSEFQHVWQDENFDDGDEIGLFFTADAVWSWDYLGDDFDQGDDCYEEFKVAELVSYEGDEFTISSVFNDDQVEANFVINEDMLTISGEDEGEEYEEIYSKNSRTRADITPLCSDQANKRKLTAPKIRSIFK